MGIKICPFCKSTDVSYTALGYVERIGAYGVSMIGTAVVDMVTPSWMHTKTGAIIRDAIPSEYVCNKCHRKFHKNQQ